VLAELRRRLFGPLAGVVRLALAPIDESDRFAHPEEAEAVASAVDARRREFATGRRLAHELLDGLGLDDGPLLLGRDRAPLWPDGATGSISHGAGHCVVAVARTERVEAVGVDLEDDGPLADDLFASILTARERAALEEEDGMLGATAKRVFCAKEATYKALSSRVRRILDFHDVEIELAGDRFVAHHDGARLEGTFAHDRGLVFAAVAVARETSGAAPT